MRPYIIRHLLIWARICLASLLTLSHPLARATRAPILMDAKLQLRNWCRLSTFDLMPYAWYLTVHRVFFFHFVSLSLLVFGQKRSAKWKIEMEYYNKTFEKLISLSLSSDSATARSYAIPSAHCFGSIRSPIHRLTGNGGIFIPFLFIYSRGAPWEPERDQKYYSRRLWYRNLI